LALVNAAEASKPAKRSAWQEAEEAGFDMSLVAANLELSVLERIRQHDRALALALALREAMEASDARV
jgi:hypothetical protein